MNYYALFYELVDDMVTRRVPFREEHLRLAREARERGELVLAGALADPVDRALLVFHVDDKSKAESFARKDPYVVNGLAKRWEVRPWKVVVGNEPPASSAASGSPARTTETILRRWSARTTKAQLPKYLEHFSKNVLPELRRVPGYLATQPTFGIATLPRTPVTHVVQRKNPYITWAAHFPPGLRVSITMPGEEIVSQVRRPAALRITRGLRRQFLSCGQDQSQSRH